MDRVGTLAILLVLLVFAYRATLPHLLFTSTLPYPPLLSITLSAPLHPPPPHNDSHTHILPYLTFPTSPSPPPSSFIHLITDTLFSSQPFSILNPPHSPQWPSYLHLTSPPLPSPPSPHLLYLHLPHLTSSTFTSPTSPPLPHLIISSHLITPQIIQSNLITISSHLIHSRPIPSHPLSSHLISSHLIPSHQHISISIYHLHQLSSLILPYLFLFCILYWNRDTYIDCMNCMNWVELSKVEVGLKVRLKVRLKVKIK